MPFRADPNRIHPVLYAQDEDAVVLGRYVEGGQAGFAMKRFADWTSVYIGSPTVQAHVLRALARLAGAHLYIEDGDIIVYANQSFVGVHSKEAGVHTVKLPAAANVVEAFDGTEVARSAQQFEVYVPAQTTRLYCLHPELLLR